jgi:hypothetical protein
MGRATIGGADLVLAIAVATCLAPRAVRAQDTPARVLVDVGDCVSLKSPDERLGCFDRHAEAARPNRDASPAPQTSAAAPAQTAPLAASIAAAPLATSTAAQPTVSAAASPATSAAPTPAQPPSMSAQSASAEQAGHDNAQHDAKAKPPEIVAAVTELHETVPNAWLITLDNGQVWRQNTAQRFALKVGERVTLRATKWGASYRLSAETLTGFIQVERVR